MKVWWILLLLLLVIFFYFFIQDLIITFIQITYWKHNNEMRQARVVHVDFTSISRQSVNTKVETISDTGNGYKYKTNYNQTRHNWNNNDGDEKVTKQLYLQILDSPSVWNFDT